MQSPSGSFPVPIEPEGSSRSRDRSLALAGGMLLGGVIVGVYSFIGLARSRRTRAATDAAAIRQQLHQLAAVALQAAEQALPPPPTIKPAYPDERLRNFGRGLSWGVVGGALYGVATATRRGSDERARWQATLQDLFTEARSAVADYSAWEADPLDDAPTQPLPFGQEVRRP